MQNVAISGPGIKFLVDNEVWDVAAWACESSCFANNPTQQLGSGLGELEIKPESLRYIGCTTRELLEDSSVKIEGWLLDKAGRVFRAQISHAIMVGDGFGKPMGILNPQAGIPICETSDATPEGTFSWQDLVSLRWQIPLMTATPSEAAPFLLGGAPVVIATQMPDVVAGSTPVAHGNWKQAYMVVNRKGVTMQSDPYSAGFCVLQKFEARASAALWFVQTRRGCCASASHGSRGGHGPRDPLMKEASALAASGGRLFRYGVISTIAACHSARFCGGPSICVNRSNHECGR